MAKIFFQVVECSCKTTFYDEDKHSTLYERLKNKDHLKIIRLGLNKTYLPMRFFFKVCEEWE